MRRAAEGVFRFVSEHNLIVLVALLLVTAGVAAGTTQLQLQSQMNGSDAVGDTEVAQQLEYIEANYGGANESNRSNVTPAAVYVRAEENALSKDALLDSLRFQRSVRENDTVAAALGDRDVIGVANLVAKRAARDPDATLDEQIAALESTSDADVEPLVEETLRPGSPALELLASEYEPGTASAESHRMVFRFADDADRRMATAALYETANDRAAPEYYTTGEHARAASNATALQNTMELIVPAALLVILAVLAFAYRDLVDVVVGFTGVVLSVLWMFGILGWLQIPAGMSVIIGPVLIVGLSVDYGLHVFMRYREQRGPEDDIREPMATGLAGVAVALALVTVTAMVGFMSNATNEFTIIKELAIAITLGVLSTFVISVTLVPALKVTIDRLLERLGLDRRKRPLGKTGLLEPLLTTGPAIARRAAPVVIVVALVAGGAGAVAWTDLDRQAVQQGDDDVAEWKQDLPGPLAWEVSEEERELSYIAERYRAADEADRSRSNVLIEDAVTTPAALESVQAVHETADDSSIVYTRDGTAPVVSPLSVMESVAAEDAAFAAAFADADTDGDGVPDQDVASLYDALFETAPDRAGRVIDRQNGEYRTIRVIVPVAATATIAEQADGMAAIAAVGDDHDGVTASAVGNGKLNQAELSQTADSILETLVIALAAVGLLLTVVYRFVTGRATLGAVTAVPIVLVSAFVIGGMWLLDVPLTLLTALLLSLVIGIGIDYNIHISDRFAQERERGRPVHDALVEATTGTGGALLGSTLTSAGAFSALLLHPHPQFQSFGTLVVLAMVTSFLVAVFVLPSMIVFWSRFTDVPSPATDTDTGASTPITLDD